MDCAWVVLDQGWIVRECSGAPIADSCCGDEEIGSRRFEEHSELHSFASAIAPHMVGILRSSTYAEEERGWKDCSCCCCHMEDECWSNSSTQTSTNFPGRMAGRKTA
jgi:hypothetical protein